MKRVIIFILIVLIILIGVGIYVSADNKMNFKPEIKFLEASNTVQTTILDNVEKNKNIKINDEEIKLEYQETRNNLDIYTNAKNEDYIFKDGKLVGFLKAADLNESKENDIEMDMELAKEIAEEFGKDNIKNFNKYDIVKENYINSYKEYSFRYMRKIKGLDTQDTVEINVNENGEVVSFSATHQGEFEKYKNIKVDIETINNLCLDAIQNKYGEKIKKTDIHQQYLKVLDEKLVLQTDVEIVLNNDESNVLTEIYELESLICEIN